MKYEVEYAIYCHTGKVRRKNQDNFWHKGLYLPEKNEGLSEILTGVENCAERPIFAVFDGMGGEICGEIAAFTAVKSFDCFQGKRKKNDLAKFLPNAFQEMNDEICEYSYKFSLGRMGTTAVMLALDGKRAYICNMGDSKAFLRDATNLSQITVDHVVNGTSMKKPPLSQHLGISKDEFIIEPYLAAGDLNHGDKYLLCSDGLTDMVSPDEIDKIVSSGTSIVESVQKLTDLSLEMGGTDNITIVLCEIKKKRFFFK